MIVDVKLLDHLVRVYDNVLAVKASLNRDLKIVSLDEDDKVIFTNLHCFYWDELIIKKE